MSLVTPGMGPILAPGAQKGRGPLGHDITNTGQPPYLKV